MSIKTTSTPVTAPASELSAGAPAAVGEEVPADSRQKAAATVRRRKEERRAESLREIRAQTADGSLIVRQMTPAQRKAASAASRETLARNEARGKRYKSPGNPAA